MRDLTELFQSTLPVRGATPFGGRGADSRNISIHAPRAGSDAWWPAPRSMPL